MDYEKNLSENQLNNVNGGEGTDEEIQRPKCPHCGSSNVAIIAEGGGMLGFRCRDCGCEW
ncbi:MAG: bacteriocin [Lachnospiraceae bacterium]|nr:bacteriocin [Lachnospiraceae bacterium]